MTLPPESRRDLERAVASARVAAERGARAALEALAVGHHEPYSHMLDQERHLRRRLRAHARQLGDRRDAESGEQAIEHLVQECAYEHWHGMLFARFLAENNLLVEPEVGVAVTLDECEELAKELGERGSMDKWMLAARFAHAMLPQVFRPDLPVFDVQFAREHRQALEALVEGLPAEAFTASDALGWVYQFWQSQKKADVNRSETKIGADELPAVTQLFTEPYMVDFLLDNSLGAWWAARRLTDTEIEAAQSEAELREKAAIPSVPLDYLRFVTQTDPDGQSPWRTAAGAFDGWPEQLADLKVLDPCCGSGHFLIAAFAMLVPMRMALEGMDASDAVDAVIRDNLNGLELDARCVEIAVFALALAAWRYPGAGGYRRLPPMNIACSGLSVGTTKAQWTALAAGQHNLRIAMDWLYDVFKDAPTLGSLLNPAGTEAAKMVDWAELSALLAQALADGKSEEQRETALAASGLAKAAELLSGQYHLVATNVPYLARGKQSETLKQFCARYPASRNDLATVFLERCLELCAIGGATSLVLPQNWLFLTRYSKLREKLLKRRTWHLLARLGEGGFESSAAAGAFVALLTLSREEPCGHERGLLNDGSAPHTMCGIDVSTYRSVSEKAIQLGALPVSAIEQARQLDNPDARVALNNQDQGALLSAIANGVHGFGSKDSPRFFRQFWELQDHGTDWQFLQTTVENRTTWLGCEQAVYWQNGEGVLAERGRLGQAVPAGSMAWGRAGIAVSQMRMLPCSLYSGEIFDKNVAVVSPSDDSHLPAIWCFCSSPDYYEAVRRIDQKMNVTNATLVKVPFDLDYWSSIASLEYPNGLPKPYSNDPTQWIFHGHPCGSVEWDDVAKRTTHGAIRADTTVLQIAVARLLGHRWPAEQDADMELAVEQRKWVDASGLLIALSDEDGIVCIPSVRGESPAAARLQAILTVAYGDAWNDGILTRLLADANGETLEDWLRNRFFEQHCKRFHNRPFIWHIWDGRKRDGFHALVNYHKLAAGDRQGRRCLESLTYSYLGDWITRQHDGVSREEPGSEERLAAALVLQKRLAAILTGEPPHDIFVRWKPIAEQPVGWEPDINDGVRLNIRPFMADDIPGGKRGAGVLRSKPNIHWRKDRGKEPQQPQEQFPWFWRDGEFTAERVNDIHLPHAQERVVSARRAEHNVEDEKES